MNLLSFSMKMSFLQVFWDGDCKHLPRLHRMWPVLRDCHMGVSFIFLSKISKFVILKPLWNILELNELSRTFLGIFIQSNGFLQQNLKRKFLCPPWILIEKIKMRARFMTWAHCGINKRFIVKASYVQVLNLNKHQSLLCPSVLFCWFSWTGLKILFCPIFWCKISTNVLHIFNWSNSGLSL